MGIVLHTGDFNASWCETLIYYRVFQLFVLRPAGRGGVLFSFFFPRVQISVVIVGVL